jgi:guanidinobutyrase
MVASPALPAMPTSSLPSDRPPAKPFNQPLGGDEVPRFAGIATMMRLPHQPTTAGLDACFVGVPFDLGTSNRPGARFGPRQVRSESVLLRPYNMATRAAPFDSLQVADIGDVVTNAYNVVDSIERIAQAYDAIVADGCRPITIGGDHTIAWPILRAMHKRYGKIGVVHVDAHADVNDTMFGEKIAHGTPFRRAVEEGLLDCDRVVQIGLRGTGYHADDFDWCRAQGFRVVQAEECWHRSLAPLMKEVAARVGNGPVYLSFDIDGLDPSFAPGTGTPEIGGLSVHQGLEIIRGLRGLDIVGADLVEISPPYDPQGTTALVGANLAFEMLCVMPGVIYRD